MWALVLSRVSERFSSRACAAHSLWLSASMTGVFSLTNFCRISFKLIFYLPGIDLMLGPHYILNKQLWCQTCQVSFCRNGYWKSFSRFKPVSFSALDRILSDIGTSL